MKQDSEPEATSKVHATSNARRVAEHRLRQRGRVELLRMLLNVTENRIRLTSLLDELRQSSPSLADALTDDPLLFAGVDQQVRVMRELTDANALANGQANVANALANAPSLVLAEDANAVANGGEPSPVEVPPPLPLQTSPTPPPPTSPSLPSQAPTSLAPIKARPRDLLIDAWADVFAEGDYRNLSEREMGQILTANKTLRQRATKAGRSEEYVADGIRTAAHNWPNVKGARSMTIRAIVDEWGALVHGPQRNGRSNGVVQHQHQYLNESATVRHRRHLSTSE